jgi:acyl carrier protein
MDTQPSRDAATTDLFKSWLFDWMAQEMGMDREKIDARQSFLSYGMDSVQAMTMVGDLEAKLEVRLPPTLAWDFADIDSLANHLADRMAPVASPHTETRQPEMSTNARTKVESLESEIAPLGDRGVDDVVHPYVESAR